MYQMPGTLVLNLHLGKEKNVFFQEISTGNAFLQTFHVSFTSAGRWRATPVKGLS